MPRFTARICADSPAAWGSPRDHAGGTMTPSARSLPNWLGRNIFASWGLILSFARASNQQLARVPGHVAQELGLLAIRCFPICMILGIVVGRFFDRFGGELQAPGQLAEVTLAPLGLLIAGMSFILLRGMAEAEQYAVDITEKGFRFLQDHGGNPVTDIIVPRIMAASLGLGLLAAATAAFVYFGASPSAAVGASSHPVVTGLAFSVALHGGLYGLAYGAYVAGVAFLVGLEGHRPLPGQVGQRFIVISTPVLLVMVGWLLWL